MSKRLFALPFLVDLKYQRADISRSGISRDPDDDIVKQQPVVRSGRCQELFYSLVKFAALVSDFCGVFARPYAGELKGFYDAIYVEVKVIRVNEG